MQTFLPYPSFFDSADVLDRQRLGKQRVEAWQVLQVLIGDKQGWANHPATKMWRGHEVWLARYGLAVCERWIARGYRDTMTPRFAEVAANLPETGPPAWLGGRSFHAAHRSNLLRKDPVWYGQYGWAEPDNLPYVWPVP